MLERRLEARKTADARGTGRRSAAAGARRASRCAARTGRAACGAGAACEHRRTRPRRSPPSQTSRAWRPRPPLAAVAAPASRAAARRPIQPSAFDALFAKVWRWFTTGNVPVKVGVVLSLFGVGFLVKEGIDREWLVLPLEVRLMFVALFGIGLLVLGWRLRTRQRTYALSVQGGGIGVLYLTIYASFALYQPLAGHARVRVARGHHGGGRRAGRAAGCARARGARHPRRLPRAGARVDGLGQSRRAVQLLRAARTSRSSASPGSRRGACSTCSASCSRSASARCGASTATRPDEVRDDRAVPRVVHADVSRDPRAVRDAHRAEAARLRRRHADVRHADRRVRACRASSSPTLEYGLAVSAVVLALLYIGMATFLYRSQRESLRVLVEAQLALSVAFVTVAVPLALDARWTSAAWALQGAALVWLAFRQQRKLALLAGVALQALSGVAYVEQSPVAAEWPILNGYCLGALMLALAGFFSSRLFDPAREGRAQHASLPDWLAKLLSIVLLVWASGWWFFGGFTEIERTSSTRTSSPRCSCSPRRRRCLPCCSRRALRGRGSIGSALTLWPFAAFARGRRAVRDRRIRRRTSAGSRGRSSIGSMFWFLREREAQFPRLTRRAARDRRIGWSPALVVWEAHWLVDRAADGVWPEAAVLALAAALTLATLRASGAVAWPFAAHARDLRPGRLRCRARGADGRDVRAQRRVGRRSGAAAVCAARQSARARQRARRARLARVARACSAGRARNSPSSREHARLSRLPRPGFSSR